MLAFANSIPILFSLLALAHGADTAAMRKQVLALGNLRQAPTVHPVDAAQQSNNIRAIYYDTIPYRGKPSRVYAWYGTPQTAGKHPAIVLVQGGGGTAYKEWVEKWVAHGFVAISIAVEGQTDRRDPASKQWLRHEWGGPAREGIYADTALPLNEQWMYHALAATVLANSLLRSMPEVDSARIGIMGISWGGVITSTIIGIDTRFAFAIPTYGCGFLAGIDNHWGKALHDNTVYREVFEPALYLKRARMPVLWLTWLRDNHFALDAQQKTYRTASGPRMVSVIPDMKHSHPAGWNPPDSYAFAKEIVNSGKPWSRQRSQRQSGDTLSAEFDSAKPIDKAELIYTAGTGLTTNLDWKTAPAKVTTRGTRVQVQAALPPGTRSGYLLLHSGSLHVSSELWFTAPKD